MSTLSSTVEVLLVESNCADVEKIAESLANQSFDLIHIDSLQDTLGYLQKHHPDIILLNLYLRDRQYLDSFNTIHTAASNIPIIVLTTLENEAISKTTLKAGAQDYLIKTEISPRTLKKAIDSATERQYLVNQCQEKKQKLAQKASNSLFLAKISKKIHNSLDLLVILKTAVEQVKQYLQVDNIFICKVDNDRFLSLLFESNFVKQGLSCELSLENKQNSLRLRENWETLAAGTIVALNKNQCFKITTNIDCKFLPSCSKLLIPIICQQQLWGLLGVEHCSTLRQWKSNEIELLEGIAVQLAIAIQQAELYQQLEQANKELERLVVIDGLTNIANRRKFDQYIAGEWQRLAREKQPLSLILCDIDYFKLYNDTYGHQSGDRCLQRVAEAISKAIKRPADLVARYGGEEFAIILPNTTVDGAKYLAQQIRLQVQALEIPHIMSPIDIYITLSLGVAGCIPSHDSAYSALIAAADSCLYRAKELGRNRVVTFPA